MARFQGSVEASNPDYYDISADFTSDSSWGNALFWEGPDATQPARSR